MKVRLPFIERIWRVKSSIAFDGPMAPEDAFEKLDPLFQAEGTEFEVNENTLTFRKHNPAAQDKLATFTSGKLSVVRTGNGSQLAYDLSSPALLMVFLAPFLFLTFGQIADVLSDMHQPAAESTREAADKPEEDDKVYELHWLDEALGAPKPEKPSEEEKAEKAKEPKHSSTPAYVLAGIFAAVFIAGRILEPWLIMRTFRKALFREEEMET